MTIPRTRIAIIGAGIGGLTLGLLLRQRGLVAAIYDQADELGEVGAAVALAANGTRVLRRLGLGEQLATYSVEPTKVLYRHWSTGHTIVEHEMGARYNERYGAEFFGIHRIHLQQVLATAWGDANLHLNSRLLELRERPDGSTRLLFANGNSVDAELVIGADGVHSVVRKWVLGDSCEAMYSETSGFRGLVPVDALPAMSDPMAFQLWLGPGGHFLHYPISGDTLNFLAVAPGPVPWSNPTWRADEAAGTALEVFKAWHPAVREMIAAVEQSPRWALFSLPPLQRWSRGNVVLLGDAAHAMLPHEGQGANQAIEDAAALSAFVAATDRSGVAQALGRYERLRRPRTRFIQHSSWVNSDVFHIPDGVQADQRNTRLQSLPSHLDWIHGYDVGRVISPDAVLPYSSPLHSNADFSRRDAVAT
ncbi:MAG TPA: FAD-dependent monooxygenase [Mycobacterium sp.]|jgi:salicylate hydroxylase|nr:FAD-dependent monooxygenase [Mycobacterium sp.]